MNELKAILSIYLPIIIFIISVIAITQIKNTKEQEININFFGLFGVALPIKSKYLYKAILSSIVIIFIVFYYVFLDFTKFYPSKIKMTIHLDVDGINTLLEELEITELNGLKIETNYITQRIKYFSNIDTVINNHLNYENYYENSILNNNFNLDTNGEIELTLKKMSGIHNYQIIEGKGKVINKKYLKYSDDTQVYISKFRKIFSPNDIFSIKIKDLLNKKIISQKFNQYLLINGKEESVFDHSLFVVTALYSMPYPTPSNSLYLYQYKDTLVPIAYAIYYSE